MPEPKSSHSLDALLDEVRSLGHEQYELVQAICAIIKKKFKPLTEEVKYGGNLIFMLGPLRQDHEKPRTDHPSTYTTSSAVRRPRGFKLYK
jgi:hypothetical protein